MTEKAVTWIEQGYIAFALAGEEGLKVEQLARAVGISKSSFYHHFADTDLFMEQLLAHHLRRASIIAAKERAATCIDPDLIDILVEHKTDLLFNRQLRINAHKPVFRDTLYQVSQVIGKDFVQLWLADAQLQLSSQQADGLFTLALENFFLQINPDTLQKDWLTAYFAHLKSLIQHFR